MKITTVPLLFFMLSPVPVSAEEAKLLAVNGGVEVRLVREGEWTSAKPNMEIPEGGAIRTGSGAGAVALMPNKTKVWLKESTALEIEQRQTLVSRLALVFGKVKIRVPHLMRRERFEVRTPAAVCAVRGTEFTIDSTEDGKMDLNVLYGEVKLNFIVPPHKGASELYIPQGQTMSLEEKGKTGTVALMSVKQEKAALENWNPGLRPEERQRELKTKESDRAQIREFARVTNDSENAVKDFLNVVKESDLEAGRTLNDVHGNLVRVDQRMMRPAANEIQFFNLVKRPEYNNKNASVARGGFVYNGAQGVASRLDYMQMTMAFNKDLPQRMEEWPSFFNGNDVNPAWSSFVMANRTDPAEIFFIAQGYKYDPARNNGDGELVNNPWVLSPAGTPAMSVTDPNDRNVILTGVLKNETGVSAMEGLNRITKLQVRDAGAGNGTLKYADATPLNGAGGSNAVWAIKTEKAVSYSEPRDRTDNAPIAQFQADMYDVGNAHGSYMWFAKENYVIGNGGGVRSAGDFTNSSSDPFTLLKSNALESVMYIKKSNGAADTAVTSGLLAKNDISADDYFAYTRDGAATAGIGTNIDLVFIPDLMVAAVQRMLPAITNLKD